MHQTAVLWVVILVLLAIFLVLFAGGLAMRAKPASTKAEKRSYLTWFNSRSRAAVRLCGKPTTWASAPCVRDVGHVDACVPDVDRIEAVEEWERGLRDEEPAPVTRWPEKLRDRRFLSDPPEDRWQELTSGLGTPMQGHEAVDGVKWFDAPPPEPSHPHVAQQRGCVGVAQMFRCACGAMREGPHGQWFSLDDPRVLNVHDPQVTKGGSR